jgi:hypothetical protein
MTGWVHDGAAAGAGDHNVQVAETDHGRARVAAWDGGGGATDLWAWPQCQAFEPIQIGQLNSNEFDFESNPFRLHLIQKVPSRTRFFLNKIWS